MWVLLGDSDFPRLFVCLFDAAASARQHYVILVMNVTVSELWFGHYLLPALII